MMHVIFSFGLDLVSLGCLVWVIRLVRENKRIKRELTTALGETRLLIRARLLEEKGESWRN